MKTNMIRSGRAPAGIVALLLVATAITGCNSRGQAITAGLPTDGYRTRYPITVQEAPETLDIPVGSGTAGLDADTRAVVASFGRDAALHGTSGVLVMAPKGSANEKAAAYLAGDISKTLKATGLSARLVALRSYPASDPSSNAPIRLVYNRIKAVSPPCGNWSEDAAPNDEAGDDGAEFGCSTQANLAAMVANPNDLLMPRAETPVPAWKRWQALQVSASGSQSSSQSSSSSSSDTSSSSGSGS